MPAHYGKNIFSTNLCWYVAVLGCLRWRPLGIEHRSYLCVCGLFVNEFRHNWSSFGYRSTTSRYTQVYLLLFVHPFAVFSIWILGTVVCLTRPNVTATVFDGSIFTGQSLTIRTLVPFVFVAGSSLICRLYLFVQNIVPAAGTLFYVPILRCHRFVS